MTNFSVLHRNPSVEKFEQQLREAVPTHIGRFIDGEPMALHEMVSDHMHLDVYRLGRPPRSVRCGRW